MQRTRHYYGQSAQQESYMYATMQLRAAYNMKMFCIVKCSISWVLSMHEMFTFPSVQTDKRNFYRLQIVWNSLMQDEACPNILLYKNWHLVA